MKSPIIERRTLIYTGHVQGVGFRYTTKNIARGHDVTGYVRNLPDGQVELITEGERQAVQAFCGEVSDRFFNQIRDERCDVGPATGEFNGFEIRH